MPRRELQIIRSVRQAITAAACLAAFAVAAAPALAQQVQFPSTSPPTAGSEWMGLGAIRPSTAPPGMATGLNPGGAVYGQPAVAAPGQAMLPNPAFSQPFPPAGYPTGSYPSVANPGGYPPGAYPGTTLPPNPYGGFGATLPGAAAPGTVYPPGAIYPNASPSVLFPGNSGLNSPWSFGGQGGANSVFPNSWVNGNNWRLGSGWFDNGTAPLLNNGPQPLRFFLGPRLQHTYLPGGDEDSPTSLEINDTDVSLVFAVPQFLGSTQPLYLLPSYSSHLWEGPSTATADLPGAAYSAFLDAGWQTDPIRTFGIEPGVRVGVFSDYETFNEDSLRVLGKLLGRVRLTPTSVLKAGAYYIDRNRYKIVPAGGIFWTPNPDTRFDLFFPEPKVAHYLATFGRTDAWSYITGYFGGGAWTITRADGAEDEVDINDLRVMVGLDLGRNELLRAGQRTGFVEAGYAFERELIYRVRPQDNTELEDSFVVRAGFGY